MQRLDSPSVTVAPSEIAHTAAFDASRRIAFVLSKVEKAIGSGEHNLPLEARIDNALLGAMHAPSLVDPRDYKLLYRLRHGRQQSGAVA